MIQIIIIVLTTFIGALVFFSINSNNYALVANPVHENLDLSTGSSCPYFIYCFHLEASTTTGSSTITITTHIFYSYNYSACLLLQYGLGNVCQVPTDLTINSFSLSINNTIIDNYIINGQLVNTYWLENHPKFSNPINKSDLYYTNTVNKNNDTNEHTYLIKGILVVNQQPVEAQLTINVHGSQFYSYQQQRISKAYANINTSLMSLIIDIVTLNGVILIIMYGYYSVKTKLNKNNQKILKTIENNVTTNLNPLGNADVTKKIQNIFPDTRKTFCPACGAVCEPDNIFCAACGARIN